MAEQTELDGQKLAYHPERLAAWQRGEDIYPVYVEIGPINRCNYRCSFCALDYTGYQGEVIPTDTLLATLEDMAAGGVKSVMFAGAGESLLHPDIISFIRRAHDLKMDVAVTTNGSQLNKAIAEAILPYLTWIRISINAGTPKTYAAIHGCREDGLEIVLENMRAAAAVKRRLELPVTIGGQCLDLGENVNEIVGLAGELKAVGVDYLSVKPFSKHPLSHNPRLKDPWPEVSAVLCRQLEALSDENFSAGFRENADAAIREESKKPYDRCLGLPFFACLEAGGDIYPCHTYMGVPEFSYGNIRKMSFADIWHSERRQKVMRAIDAMLKQKCRKACRLDQINRFLHALRHPPAHVNFI